MMPIGQFGLMVDGGRAQCGLGDHQGGQQGGGTGAAWNVGDGVLVSCHHVGDNICSWTIGEVTVVIEMVVNE